MVRNQVRKVSVNLKMERTCVLVNRLAICAFVASLILFLIGFSTEFWTKFLPFDLDLHIEEHLGLGRICLSVYSVSLRVCFDVDHPDLAGDYAAVYFPITGGLRKSS